MKWGIICFLKYDIAIVKMFKVCYSIYVEKYKLRVMVNLFGSLEIIFEMLAKVMGNMGFLWDTFVIQGNFCGHPEPASFRPGKYIANLQLNFFVCLFSSIAQRNFGAIIEHSFQIVHQNQRIALQYLSPGTFPKCVSGGRDTKDRRLKQGQGVRNQRYQRFGTFQTCFGIFLIWQRRIT